MQTLTTHKTTILTRQEHKTRSHLRWLSRSAHRRGELTLRLLVHRCWDQWCPDGSWTYAVHADTVAELLVRETACEGYDGALCGGVVEEVGTADVVVYG